MSARNRHTGVSFVIPVHNGRRRLPEVIEAIEAQRDGRPFEIVAVDDGGSDGSSRWLREQAAAGRLTLVSGPGRGAAAAINAGLRAATHPIVCQIDQDVVIARGWLERLLAALDEPDVAAAQGHYVTAPNAGFWARMMGRDLELRYARIGGGETDHVCTGNSVYRASALHGVGLLDEDLGYGYDNDLSYRLLAAGHCLSFVPEAKSVHFWREGLAGYLRQQFGVGYGRLDVIARHPDRAGGDRVSGALMIAHAPLMLAACLCLLSSAGAVLLDLNPTRLARMGAVILAALFLERLVAGIAAWRRTNDRAAIAFAVAHLLRDVAWAAAIVLWCGRRLTRARPSPGHSMRRRSPTAIAPAGRWADHVQPHTLLAVIPAFNEAANLPRVVRELRARAPLIDILIVNDGSTDGTDLVLPRLGVQWLTLPQRVGVGGAVRAGLRYALRRGYRFVVRMDGDGQHRPCDVGRLLAPVLAGRADAVIGSRFMHRRRRWRFAALRTAQAGLAMCLTVLTRQPISDPTSGFCVFGPRALALLGRHHPTGYAEPELLLLLSRNGLRFTQVPIRIRPRLAGRTSLTPSRALVAFARTLLAIVIVPVRRALAEGVVNGPDDGGAGR